MAENNNFFNRLTRLFRSGPLVKRKIKANRAPNMGSLLQQFQKSQSHVYANAISAYGMYDRMSRYADFQEMEATPEIASALDIYSDESASQDEVGRVLHIYSENDKIRSIFRAIYSKANAVVRVQKADGSHTYSRSFDVRRGVLQGDIFSPLCFIVALSRIMGRDAQATSRGRRRRSCPSARGRR